MQGGKVNIQNEHRWPRGKVAASERCENEETQGHPVLVADKDIDAHHSREFKELGLNHENNEQAAAEQTKTQQKLSKWPFRPRYNVNNDMAEKI